MGKMYPVVTPYKEHTNTSIFRDSKTFIAPETEKRKKIIIFIFILQQLKWEKGNISMTSSNLRYNMKLMQEKKSIAASYNFLNLTHWQPFHCKSIQKELTSLTFSHHTWQLLAFKKFPALSSLNSS